jgi:hypothetical protein
MPLEMLVRPINIVIFAIVYFSVGYPFVLTPLQTVVQFTLALRCVCGTTTMIDCRYPQKLQASSIGGGAIQLMCLSQMRSAPGDT